MSVQTKDIAPRQQGKIIQLDYDFITTLEGQCSYCLTDAQVQMILAIVDFYGWSTRWFSSSGLIDQQTITDLQSGLVEALMDGCCEEPILGTIFDPATGEMQVTRDGTTYTPAQDEGLDPRYTAPSYPPLVPVEGEDIKCRAASNVIADMKDKVEEIADQLETGLDIVALVTELATIVLASLVAPEALPIFVPIFIALGQAILSVAKTAYLDAFTNEVYDDLLCILFDDVGSDGTYSESNFLSILTDIDSKFTGNIALTFSSTIKGWGVNLLNNKARIGAAALEDCAACDECIVTPYIPPGGGTMDSRSGCVIIATSFDEGGHQALYLWIDNPTGTYDPTLGGIITDVTILSGAISLQGYNEKPSGTLHFPALTIDHVELSQAYWQSSVPFQLQITADA